MRTPPESTAFKLQARPHSRTTIFHPATHPPPSVTRFWSRRPGRMRRARDNCQPAIGTRCFRLAPRQSTAVCRRHSGSGPNIRQTRPREISAVSAVSSCAASQILRCPPRQGFPPRMRAHTRSIPASFRPSTALIRLLLGADRAEGHDAATMLPETNFERSGFEVEADFMPCLEAQCDGNFKAEPFNCIRLIRPDGSHHWQPNHEPHQKYRCA